MTMMPVKYRAPRKDNQTATAVERADEFRRFVPDLFDIRDIETARDARRALSWLLRQEGYVIEDIGRAIGHHHATVLADVKCVNKRSKTGHPLIATIEQLRRLAQQATSTIASRQTEADR